MLERIVDIHGTADVHSRQILAGHFIGVVRGENGNEGVSVIIGHGSAGSIDRRRQVMDRKHNALCRTGRAGGKDKCRHLFLIGIRIGISRVTFLDSLLTDSYHLLEFYVSLVLNVFFLVGSDRNKLFNTVKLIANAVDLVVH